MGENHLTAWPIALYGILLFMAGVAYYILAHCLIAIHGKNSTLAVAFGKDRKGIISVVYMQLQLPLLLLMHGTAWPYYAL
jgi:uncharacterized membrane protein